MPPLTPGLIFRVPGETLRWRVTSVTEHNRTFHASVVGNPDITAFWSVDRWGMFEVEPPEEPAPRSFWRRIIDAKGTE